MSVKIGQQQRVSFPPPSASIGRSDRPQAQRGATANDRFERVSDDDPAAAMMAAASPARRTTYRMLKISHAAVAAGLLVSMSGVVAGPILIAAGCVGLVVSAVRLRQHVAQ